MKSRVALPLFPVLLVALMVTCSNQAAAEVSVGVSVGGGDRYSHRGCGVVTYRTVDPVYRTWYPDHSPTYVAPRVYSTPTYYVAPTTTYYVAPTRYHAAPYVYRAPPHTSSLGAFFGSGGNRSYQRHHDSRKSGNIRNSGNSRDNRDIRGGRDSRGGHRR